MLLLNRLILVAFCLLPALGVGVRTPHANFVASFMYACDSSTPDPHLKTRYTAAGKPKPRAKTAFVEVYQAGQAPTRTFIPLGEVSVLANSSRMSVDELTDWARRGARQLGGDAIVEVKVDDAGHVQPKAGDVGVLYLSASVVRWE